MMYRIFRITGCRQVILALKMMIAFTSLLNAQKPSDFNGTWIIDHSKSDAAVKDYQITCKILQTQQLMTVEQIFRTKEGHNTSMEPIRYNLDGKETVKKEQGGTDKVSAIWSADKKTITTKFIRTMNGTDFGSITTYTLSADGKMLIVKSSGIKGDYPMVQVYRKQ